MGEMITNFGGNISGQFISPIHFELNDFTFNSIPSGSADIRGNTIPPEIFLLQNKVKRKTKELRDLGDDFPQRELLRRKLTQFYEGTTNPDGLADQLYQTNVLSDYQRLKIKNEKMDYDKNVILYDIVTSKEAIVELLPALKKSGNDYILKLIDTLVVIEIQTLREKLAKKLKQLTENGVSNPLEEFFRPKLTTFYSETTNPDTLADKLYEAKTFSKQNLEQVKSKNMRYDKNVALYDLVVSKTGVIELLGALKTSGNENILILIEELADRLCF